MNPPVPLTLQVLESTRVPGRLYSRPDLEALVAFVLKSERVTGPAELAVNFTSPAAIRQMNRHFRGVDRSTDVISFRYTPRPRLTGDLAINVRQAIAQAIKVGHPARREIRLLVIHGILHLLDYTDYEPRPRRRMFRRQNQLLRRWESHARK